MSKKLYAVVLDKNMIVSDLIGGGIAVYENIKTAKIRLEQIYHTVKRNALKLGAKHVFKRRYSIKEYIWKDNQTQIAIQELEKLRNNILINQKGDDSWTSLEVDLQYLVDTINEQIEKLEGKKDAEN